MEFVMKKILMLAVLLLASCTPKGSTYEYDPYKHYDYHGTIDRNTIVSYNIDPNDSSCSACVTTGIRSSSSNNGRPTHIKLKEAVGNNSLAKIEQRNAFYNQGITKGPERSAEEQRKVDAVNMDPSCKTTFLNGKEVKRCMSWHTGNTICFFKDNIKQTDFECIPEQDYMNNNL